MEKEKKKKKNTRPYKEGFVERGLSVKEKKTKSQYMLEKKKR